MFRLACDPKELWVVNAKHVDFYPLARQEYEQRVLFFRTTSKAADAR